MANVSNTLNTFWIP